MAKVQYIDLSGGLQTLYFRGLTNIDRFVFGKVSRKIALLSRKKKKGLTARSLLPGLSLLWKTLTPTEQQAWIDAGAICDLKGYRLFVQDTTIRIMNDLPGIATPDDLHQSWVGLLSVEAPATELKIAQLHPRSYWVSQPVPKHKGMREPVLITEDFALPLDLGISYKSDLDAVGAVPYARFYARVWSSYQGVDLYTDVSTELDLVADWKQETAILSAVNGYVVGYTLYIHLHDVRGTVYIDNVSATHSAQNWVRDPFCKDIDQAFTKAFYQVPKHWVADVIPEGASFGSTYPE
jgi:hypothetical protein